jgi:hypothetical protein
MPGGAYQVSGRDLRPARGDLVPGGAPVVRAASIGCSLPVTRLIKGRRRHVLRASKCVVMPLLAGRGGKGV